MNLKGTTFPSDANIPGHVQCFGTLTGRGYNFLNGAEVGLGGNLEAQNVMVDSNSVSSLSGGRLSCTILWIGKSSEGHFTQFDSSLVAGNLYIGNNYPGTFLLSGGTIVAGVYVGCGAGTGTFTVTDGNSNGTLNVGVNMGRGTVWQTGGQMTGTINVGRNTSAIGPFSTYTLDGNGMVDSGPKGSLNVSGKFAQNGGTVHIESLGVSIGSNATWIAQYQLAGGTLDGNSERVQGQFLQTGGTRVVRSSLSLDQG